MNIGLIRMRYTPYGGAEVFLSRFIDGLCHIVTLEWSNNARDGVTIHVFH